MPADFRLDDGRRVTNAISRRLATEASAGTVDPLRFPEVPAIPSVTRLPRPRDKNGESQADLSGAVLAMKQILDLREGRSGSVLDKALTMRDLMDEGLAAFKFGNQTITGSAPGSVTIPGGGYIDPRPVLLIPPTLQNFTATAAFKNVVVDWDMLDYANHAFVEIWRSTTNALGTATLIGTTTANLFADASGAVGTTYYYWGRAVAIGGALGPFNAVGGTAATLGSITGTDLADLSVTAAKLSQGTYPNINLVPNGSAEDGTEAWVLAEVAAAGGTLSVDTTIKTGGLQGFKITKAASTDGVGFSCRSFPVIPGETYSVKVQARADAAMAAGFYLRMSELTSKPSTGYIGTGVNGLTNPRSSWTDLIGSGALTTSFVLKEFSYTVPAGVYWVSLTIYSWTVSTPALVVYFDDCSVGRQITASFLAANSIAVGTAAIQNGAIVNAMIGTAAIDSAKIADAAIVTAKIADLNVTGAKIADATITTAKIVDANITTAKIADANITTAKIGDAQITNAKIVDATITEAKIDSLRGLNVNASSHTTKGSYFTSSVSAAATTVNVKNTTDFASSGTAAVIDTTNDRDVFTYTGKTSTTLTGCSGVLAHNSGATIIPLAKAMVVDGPTNEMRFYGDRGDGTIEELASIGTTATGSDFTIAKFGSLSSGNVHWGAQILSGAADALIVQSTSGRGIVVSGGAGDVAINATGGSSASGIYGASSSSSATLGGVHGENNSGGNAVFGQSSNGVGVLGSNSGTGAAVQGSNTSSGAGVRGISSSGPGVYGSSSSSGYGVQAQGTTTRAPLRLIPQTTIPSGQRGDLYSDDTDGHLYYHTGSAWIQVDNN